MCAGKPRRKPLRQKSPDQRGPPADGTEGRGGENIGECHGLVAIGQNKGTHMGSPGWATARPSARDRDRGGGCVCDHARNRGDSPPYENARCDAEPPAKL